MFCFLVGNVTMSLCKKRKEEGKIVKIIKFVPIEKQTRKRLLFLYRDDNYWPQATQ